jgi:cbb3-type cytochrome oxidase subunit 3
VSVLVVALLLLVVALASRPEDGGGTLRLGGDPVRLLLDVGVYLFAVLALLSLLVVIWALWPRPNEELPALPPRQRRVLSTVLTTITLVGLAVWLRSTGRLGPRQGLILGGGAAGAPAGLAAQGGRGAAGAGFDWLAAGIVVALLLAAAALAWWFLRPRARTGRGLSLARLQALLDDAIDDVLGEADPRRAVIAAWARLERVLAGHGVPRRESEAPFEYAARAERELDVQLGVDRGWLEQLAGLFEWARFSTHDVTPAMREQALGGLVAVRDGLRLAAS